MKTHFQRIDGRPICFQGKQSALYSMEISSDKEKVNCYYCLRLLRRKRELLSMKTDKDSNDYIFERISELKKEIKDLEKFVTRWQSNKTDL